MKVVHLNTFDSAGGAAIAAHRLHVGLQQQGVDSHMLVLDKHGDDPSVQRLSLNRAPWRSLSRRRQQASIARDAAAYGQSRPTGYEIFSDDRTEYGPELVQQLHSCDIVHLHWVAHMLDYRSFFRTVPQRTPVVWTLHDMNPFTGGCHYDHGCGKFVSRCGACPQLGSTHHNDLSAQVWKRKQQALTQVDKRRLHLVAPSRWLATEVQHSSLLGHFPVTVIPNGVDTTIFRPHQQTVARAALDLPLDARIVLFAAESLENRRKGSQLLQAALNGLHNESLLLLTIGRGELRLHQGLAQVPMGFIRDARLFALVYAAADLFVIPSLQDNLPNTVVEALACGTPVLGFNTGGIPDMVRPGQTGELVPPGDVGALRACLAQLLNDMPKLAAMRSTCRQLAEQEYSLATQARRSMALYHSLTQ
ncbi:MAG: glycosyltransferase family 4 protein [Chloroflexaceae bacterium]|jgi:glycosyltransferase involved in cell wall biosynthesis|nr:glycosyltransferase family 4 protein [Chloroflexaceae bacterium]